MNPFRRFFFHCFLIFQKHSLKLIWAEALVLAVLLFLCFPVSPGRGWRFLPEFPPLPIRRGPPCGKKPGEMVDFHVTSEAMNQAFRYDVDTLQKEVHLNWVDLLALLGAKYGGDFSAYKAEDMSQLAEAVLSGETTMDMLRKEWKNFDYYREAYGAVLDGMVGVFQAEIPASEAPAEYQTESTASQSPPDTVWVTKYGLKAFSPIAKGFPYNDYDDFGAARSYGFKRQHLGHDMMGQVGTPIIAVESGHVEAIGWNPYGGWRLGIRSLDKNATILRPPRKTTLSVKSLTRAAMFRQGM